MTELIALSRVARTYLTGGEPVHALVDIDLEIENGAYVAIIGSSGSGKSTLMNVIGCLDSPSRGEYRFDGEPVQALSDEDLAAVRNRKIGFVFQTFHLLPRQNALQNVELPLIYRGVPAAERRARARQALEAVGLGHRLDHRPNQLSGGQCQRVAIARALVGDPRLILADEPTGNLDSKTSAEMMRLFDDLHAQGRTIVLITHEAEVAAHARRTITLQDGRVVADLRAPRV
jgi:putative ABC transport system ATP-binding protein